MGIYVPSFAWEYRLASSALTGSGGRWARIPENIVVSFLVVPNWLSYFLHF
jgi:hypothetical protein